MLVIKIREGCDNPEYFLQKIRELRDEKQLSKEVFKEIVEEYLLDFNDHHISFKIDDSQTEKAKVRGFRVRRFEDRLYVTDVDSEKRLKPGMYFVSLGGHSIAELRERHHRLLNENHAEREDWTPILSIYDEGEIENSEGKLSVIPLAYYDKRPIHAYLFSPATTREYSAHYDDRFCGSRCHYENDNGKSSDS